jgi:hypothetical protein
MQLQQLLCAHQILVVIFLVLPRIRRRFRARGNECKGGGWVLNSLLVKA